MINYSGQIRILCVDDEKNVLKALERFFLDDNFEIVNAGSGAEGLQALEASGQSGPFQLVISDYRMPVMNGVEFLKAVYGRWPETVRLVLSGYADVGAIVAAINEGHIYKFIPKPWNDDDLRVTVQNSLERYFLQQRNRELLQELAAANQELEEKVRQRTEQLELRNRALEFSQSLLGNLPLGVAGLDRNGRFAYCNDIAAALLFPGGDPLGANIAECGNAALAGLAEDAKEGRDVSGRIVINGVSCLVLGRGMTFFGSGAVVLVLQEGCA